MKEETDPDSFCIFFERNSCIFVCVEYNFVYLDPIQQTNLYSRQAMIRESLSDKCKNCVNKYNVLYFVEELGLESLSLCILSLSLLFFCLSPSPSLSLSLSLFLWPSLPLPLSPCISLPLYLFLLSLRDVIILSVELDRGPITLV
jgi:hypothetical protein